jgi:hypothetical protein
MNDLAEMREVIDDLHGAHQLYEQVLAGRRRVGRLSCCAFVFVDEAAEDVTAVELPRCG